MHVFEQTVVVTSPDNKNIQIITKHQYMQVLNYTARIEEKKWSGILLQ